MLGASFLPARFRSDHGHIPNTNPGYIHRQITSFLQSISSRAFTHPIHTIVFVALLASTSYVGVLEGSLSDSNPSKSNTTRGADLMALVEGGRQLKVDEQTKWRWQLDNGVIGVMQPVGL